MIKSFKNKGLQRLAAKGDASKLSVPAAYADRVTRQLAALNVAKAPEEMAVPGWRFHELKGDRKGTYSITVSGNWRITFKFEGEDATDVDLEDYH